ncbi:hypothetical protein YC2023_119341 [Brassica napus]
MSFKTKPPSTPQTAKSYSPVSLSAASHSPAPPNLFPPIAGVLALSPGEFPFWRQVTSAFNVIPKFALCLPSSGTSHFYVGAVNRYIIPPSAVAVIRFR